MGMKLPSLTEVPQGLTSWHEWDTQGLAWWKLHEYHDPERGAPAPFNHWKHLKTSQTFQKLSPAETTSFKIIAFFQITRKTVNMYHSWYVTAFFCLFFFWFRWRCTAEGCVICSLSSAAVHPVVSFLPLAFLNFICIHQCPKPSGPWKELAL